MNAPAPMIWLPDGQGAVDIRVWRLTAAAREYDARLTVGRNEESGQWSVYIALERGTMPELNDQYPIYGLGHSPSEFPHPDDLKRKLFQMDLVRNGQENLDKMNRENERLKKEQAQSADEATMEAAEAFEWATRRLTNDISKRRIQVNLAEKAVNRHRSST